MFYERAVVNKNWMENYDALFRLKLIVNFQVRSEFLYRYITVDTVLVFKPYTCKTIAFEGNQNADEKGNSVNGH